MKNEIKYNNNLNNKKKESKRNIRILYLSYEENISN